MKKFLVILLFIFVTSVTAQQKNPAPSRGVPTIRVWVDTEYGYYHCPTSKLYGKTKQGVYMTQKKAQDRGYRPAYGTYCTTTTPPKTATKAVKKV